LCKKENIKNLLTFLLRLLLRLVLAADAEVFGISSRIGTGSLALCILLDAAKLELNSTFRGIGAKVLADV
jgi:hypothetical protein